MLKTNCFNNTLQLISYSQETTDHRHDYYQWVLPLKGHLELQVDSKSGVVHDDVGAFIRSQENHVFAAREDNLFLVLDSREKPWLNHLVIPAFWQLSPSMKKFLRFAQEYLSNQKDFISQIQVADLLEKLLMEQFDNQSDYQIAKTIDWIDNHFNQPVSLKKLADRVYLSVSQLQRRFKQVTGETIGEYWRRKRISKAKVLLSNPILSVELVAYQVGYENLSAFSRSFAREVGVSPTFWRDMTFSAKDMHLSGKTNS
jgi:AraC-like DNA-binding protein